MRIVTVQFEANPGDQFTLDVLGPYSSAVLMNWYHYDCFVKGEDYLSYPIPSKRFGVPHAGPWFLVVLSESRFIPRVEVKPVQKVLEL